jgi:hypothetical protein
MSRSRTLPWFAHTTTGVCYLIFQRLSKSDDRLVAHDSFESVAHTGPVSSTCVPQRKSPVRLHRALPLLGSNQDSPDPEGPCNRPNSSNLPPFTRVRVTRCRSLPAFMPDFAVLYSLKCRSLPSRSAPSNLTRWTTGGANYAVREFLLRPVEPQVELKGTFAHMTARSTILKTSDHVSRAIRFALSWLLCRSRSFLNSNSARQSMSGGNAPALGCTFAILFDKERNDDTTTDPSQNRNP